MHMVDNQSANAASVASVANAASGASGANGDSGASVVNGASGASLDMAAGASSGANGAGLDVAAGSLVAPAGAAASVGVPAGSLVAPANSPTKDLSNWEPRIVAFACHWCTYSGADLAGLNRMNYPANIRLLRVPCSGRVNPQYILSAFNKGCDGVLVCGCHPGDCHYATGNYYAKRRLMAFKRLLEFSGLEKDRFQVRWISGSEAGKFRDTVTAACELIRALGPIEAPVKELKEVSHE